jgi:hypothetical protein
MNNFKYIQPPPQTWWYGCNRKGFGLFEVPSKPPSGALKLAFFGLGTALGYILAGWFDQKFIKF